MTALPTSIADHTGHSDNRWHGRKCKRHSLCLYRCGVAICTAYPVCSHLDKVANKTLFYDILEHDGYQRAALDDDTPQLLYCYVSRILQVAFQVQPSRGDSDAHV